MSAGEPAARHAALSTDATPGRRSTDTGDHRFGESVWALWLPAYHCDVETRRMVRGQRSRAAHLATRRAEGSRQTTAAEKIMAQRRKLHPAAARASQSRVELRFRGCAHA